MLCAIYRSNRKAGMYLYIENRDQFEPVPDDLLKVFGRPEFVMLFNLKGNKQLALADNQDVLQKIQEQGFYLQMPPKLPNLLEQLKQRNRK